MSTYRELYLENELEHLRDGLAVLDGIVDPAAIKELDLHLFGIVHDTDILYAAKEILAEYMDGSQEEGEGTEISPEDIDLNEIAISIPILGASIIDVLHGRGINLKEYALDFAYKSSESEGVRTQSFSGLSFSTYLTINDLEVKALSDSDMNLDEFLTQKGMDKGSLSTHEVSRNDSATKEKAPLESKERPPEAQPPQGTPKKTSLKIAAIVEDFLG